MARCFAIRALIVCWLALLPVRAFAQSNIDESEITSTYWVDGVNGSDSNAGTREEPFETIGKAAGLAQANKLAGLGTRININPGTYRESISLLPDARDSDVPIVFQAVTTGTVILNGADVWTGWQPYTGNAAVYTNSWPYLWGLCSSDTGGAPFEQDIVLRREMIVVNGTPLTQVLALTQMREGTFSVQESTGTVYIWPPAGTDINSATVEVAVRPNLITVQGKSDIVLRGLTFQYANSCRTDSAVPIKNSSNILLDTDYFYWNNAQGPGMAGDTNVTVQYNIANHNGQGGISGYEGVNTLWVGNQVSYNNWRGAQGAYYHWSSSGFHPYAMHTATFNGNVTSFNQTFGIHWDTDNQNITVDSLIASQNLLAEAFVEKSEGPFTLTNSYMCNGNPYTGSNGTGFEARNSEGITLTGNTIDNNDTEFSIFGVAGGLTVTNWQTGEVYNLVTQNMTLTSNTIAGVTNQPLFYDGTLGGDDWTTFQTTFTSNLNTWWNGEDSTPFTVPVPTNFTQLNFAGWQATTLQDVNSTFAQPATGFDAKCQVTPDAPDFWFVIDQLTVLQPVTAGGTAVFNDLMVPLNFTGTVTLAVDGLQRVPGTTTAWDTQSITGSGTAKLTVGTTTATPTGVYPITMIATNASTTHTVTGSLMVNTVAGIDPLILNFGDTNLGSSSSTMTSTLYNAGAAPLAISGIAVTGDFTQTTTCGVSLDPGDSCAVTVTFTPTLAGIRSGTLVFTDVDPGSPQTVTLTGVGVAVPLVTLSPASVDFGNVNTGTSSQPVNVTLTNSGTAVLDITGITFGGLNGSDFTETSTCGATLDPALSCTVSVTFTPGKAGARTGTLLFSDDASSGSQLITLTGNGSSPLASLSTTAVDFGNLGLGNVSDPVTMTLSNTGDGPLTIFSFAMIGADPEDFGQSNSCPVFPSTLAAGSSCDISVVFAPLNELSFSAILGITDDSVDSQQALTLTGVGTDPGITLLQQ